MAQKTWTDKQEAAIVEQWTTGATVPAILAEHGGTYSALHRMLTRRGCAPRSGRVFTKAELTDMKRRWERGESQEVIAQIHSCSQTTVGRQLRKMGAKPPWEIGARRGADHYAWKGGVTITDGGYLLERVSPDSPMFVMANRAGYVPQHRLVMANHLGRPLAKSETVHHIDGNKQNNHIVNLQLRNGAHGKGAAFVCLNCGSNNVASTALAEEETP